MVSHWHTVVCVAAKIKGFWFRDFRHSAATRWARERGISAEALNAAMAGPSAAGSRTPT
jgi:hypothetical protein